MNNSDDDFIQIQVSLPTDEEGYLDRECPSEHCGMEYKVLLEDWENIVKDEEVYCAFCRFIAPADQWFTQEQVEHLNQHVMNYVQGKVHNMFDDVANKINSSQNRNSFISMRMEVGSKPSSAVLPIYAADAMRVKITCEACSCRFAVVGAAFFCPACGHNSAQHTFQQSLKSVEKALNLLDSIKQTIEVGGDRDAARETVRLITENGLQNAIMAFQRFAEAVYMGIPNQSQPKRNIFQRLDEGSTLCQKATGKGYRDFIAKSELDDLQVFFQQRHLLAHREGIVDSDYIERSGDSTYSVGQRLVIKKDDVLALLLILDKLASGMNSSANSFNQD